MKYHIVLASGKNQLGHWLILDMCGCTVQTAVGLVLATEGCAHSSTHL